MGVRYVLTYQIAVCPNCEAGPLFFCGDDEGMTPRTCCRCCGEWVLQSAAKRINVQQIPTPVSSVCMGPDGKGCMIPHDCDGKCACAPWNQKWPPPPPTHRDVPFRPSEFPELVLQRCDKCGTLIIHRRGHSTAEVWTTGGSHLTSDCHKACGGQVPSDNAWPPFTWRGYEVDRVRQYADGVNILSLRGNLVARLELGCLR